VRDKYYTSIILLALFIIGASAGFQSSIQQTLPAPASTIKPAIDDFSLYLRAAGVNNTRDLYDRYATKAIHDATQPVSLMNESQLYTPWTLAQPSTSFTNLGPQVALSSSFSFLSPAKLEIKKRKKDLLLFTMLAVLVFVSGWSLGTTYGSVNRSPSAAPLTPVGEPYHYILFSSGAMIQARNGWTGQIDYSGTDAASVLQQAVNALTRNRNSIETIVIRGSFTISKSTLLTSYTKIILEGTLRLADSVNQPIFKIVTTPTTEVQFSGGTYDLNSQANPNPSNAIDFQDSNTSYVIVHDVSFLNVPQKSFGVHFTAPNNQYIIIDHNTCYSCGGSVGFSSGGLFYADFGSDVFVTNNRMSNDGIDIRISTPIYSVIANNTIRGNYPHTGGGGVTLVGKGGHDDVLLGNVISGKAQECIEIVQVARVSIADNNLLHCANEGLHIWGMTSSIVGANLLLDNGAHSPDNSNITAQITLGLYGDSARYNWIVNNVIYADGASTLPQYGIWENTNSDYNLFHGNVIRGYTIAAYRLQGTHDVLDGNSSSLLSPFQATNDWQLQTASSVAHDAIFQIALRGCDGDFYSIRSDPSESAK